GAGIPIEESDLAFRCDFATVDGDFRIVDERAGRINGLEAEELARSLEDMKLKNHGVEVVFKHIGGHKGVLILKGENLSPNIKAEQPKISRPAIESIRPEDNSPKAQRTAQMLRELVVKSNKLLEDHPVNKRRLLEGRPPANIVIPWGVGLKPKLNSIHDKYGLKGACVAAANVIKGVCKLCGMNILHVEGATGDLRTNVIAKAEAALRALENHNLVFVHVEASDEASHDGDVYGKIEAIRKIDRMVGVILEAVNLDEVCIALTADHATPTKLRIHTADPTPISIACNDVVPDGVQVYSERAAYDGGLGHIRGCDVMPTLLNIAGNPVKVGI
ncbi:MAG: phosphoglycerate mutase, partial [Candidatus Bathyarchaeia archaeon]